MSVPWWQTAVIYQIYRARFRTAMATASATLAVSNSAWTMSLNWARTRSGCPNLHVADGGFWLRYCRLQRHRPAVWLDGRFQFFISSHSPTRPQAHSGPGAQSHIRPISLVRAGGPPNNWKSEFGGRTWEHDSRTSEYYYHAFLPQQPDLNWRNADVRAAMYDVMRFWLGLGIDGFRIDVIWHLIKDELFRRPRSAWPSFAIQFQLTQCATECSIAAETDRRLRARAAGGWLA
jgi:hypothetical protein